MPTTHVAYYGSNNYRIEDSEETTPLVFLPTASGMKTWQKVRSPYSTLYSRSASQLSSTPRPGPWGSFTVPLLVNWSFS